MREISEYNHEINASNGYKLDVLKSSPKKVGTASFEDGERHMEYDQPQGVKFVPNRESDAMEIEDGDGAPESEDLDRRHQELLKEAVDYGKELKQLFKADQSQLVTETMTNIFGMIAYKDPNQSDQAYLLDKSQRGSVAEAVNSAILGMSRCLPIDFF